ncbi:lecithin retinol acyltransferase family protein [Pseudoalteromonas piscicida]|nr:lecithin retinol acyltransferase family protein [Pseudoalteromonas piscicida]MDP4489910.1 lecithin retinol acyltransferase family protein [Pseudoalteromonas piscicida]
MIVHLNGDGLVEKVDGFQFVRRLGGKNPSRSIYVSCKEGKAIGSPEAAQRAIDKVGSKIKYDLIENNCHDFVARCFIDDSSGMVYGRLCLTYSALSSQSLITTIANRLLEADNWKVWGVS